MNYQSKYPNLTVNKAFLTQPVIAKKFKEMSEQLQISQNDLFCLLVESADTNGIIAKQKEMKIIHRLREITNISDDLKKEEINLRRELGIIKKADSQVA